MRITEFRKLGLEPPDVEGGAGPGHGVEGGACTRCTASADGQGQREDGNPRECSGMLGCPGLRIQRRALWAQETASEPTSKQVLLGSAEGRALSSNTVASSLQTESFRPLRSYLTMPIGTESGGCVLNFPTSKFQWGWPNSRFRLGSTAGVVATGGRGREPHGPLDHTLLLGHCPCMASTGSSLSDFPPAGLTFSDLHPLESHGTPSWKLFHTDTHSLADFIRQTHSGHGAPSPRWSPVFPNSCRSSPCLRAHPLNFHPSQSCCSAPFKSQIMSSHLPPQILQWLSS